ncbi:MAG: hypothetical protein ACRD1A_06940 [Terriglobales bacterium]
MPLAFAERAQAAHGNLAPLSLDWRLRSAAAAEGLPLAPLWPA